MQQYTDNEGRTLFTEPVSRSFRARTLDTICDTPSLKVYSVNSVFSPCAHADLFAADGCMTVAAAAAVFPDHPLGLLPYAVDAAAPLALLRNPNMLVSKTLFANTATVLLPTAAASLVFLRQLQTMMPAGSEAGVSRVTTSVTLEGELTNVSTDAQDALAAAALYAMVGGRWALYSMLSKNALELNSLVPLVYCLAGDPRGPKLRLSIAQDSAPQTASVYGNVNSVDLTEVNNNRVCSGIVHLVSDQLLPCPLPAFTPSPLVHATLSTIPAGVPLSSAALFMPHPPAPLPPAPPPPAPEPVAPAHAVPEATASESVDAAVDVGGDAVQAEQAETDVSAAGRASRHAVLLAAFLACVLAVVQLA